MRLARRLLWLAVLVLGSILGLDQGLFHAGADDAAGQGAPSAVPAQIGGPFESPAACEQALSTRSQSGWKAARHGPRVGSWNVRWFPRGTHDGKDPSQHTDVAWLACAIAWLDVDVLAVQEFLDNPEARNASADLLERLDVLTGGRHHLELDDCAGSGRQHVGLLWDERRVTLSDVRAIAALNPVGTTCGASLRPGFGAHARFRDGTDLHLISVHLDSGEQARDFEHRKASLDALDGVVRELRASDGDAVVLGDYNAMGCQTCTPPVAAIEELASIDATARALGLTRLEHALGNQCSHYYRGRTGLLDLALTTDKLRARVSSIRADGVCAALACARPKRGAGPLAWQTLSDHCPVVIELKRSGAVRP